MVVNNRDPVELPITAPAPQREPIVVPKPAKAPPVDPLPEPEPYEPVEAPEYEPAERELVPA